MIIKSLNCGYVQFVKTKYIDWEWSGHENNFNRDRIKKWVLKMNKVFQR